MFMGSLSKQGILPSFQQLLHTPTASLFDAYTSLGRNVRKYALSVPAQLGLELLIQFHGHSFPVTSLNRLNTPLCDSRIWWDLNQNVGGKCQKGDAEAERGSCIIKTCIVSIWVMIACLI